MARETKSLGQKDKLDKFYTKENIVDFCLSKIDLNKYKYIIEPSAGNGSFSNKIDNCIAIDLEPEAENIIECDYFDFDYKPYGGALVIGNPPFGQQSTLAIKFFNYSARYAETIAFILPKSFKKTSIQNKLDKYFILTESYDLDESSFTLNGEDYKVPCVFQIWNRTEKERPIVKLKTTSELFEFTKEADLSDFRVQRVGGKAGHAFMDKAGAVSSNYYLINKSNFTTEELVNIINSLKYPSICDTVGPKSLPKGEFILELETKLGIN